MMVVCRMSLVFWIGLVLVAGSADAGTGPMIRFRRTAYVTGSVVRLGDVADIHDADVVAEEQLKAIVLAPAPAPGRQTVLEFVSIRSRLQARGVDLASTEFSGASAVRVIRRAEPTAHEPRPPSDGQAERAAQRVREVIAKELLAAGIDTNELSVAVRLSRSDVPRVLSAEPASLQVSRLTLQPGRPQTLILTCRDAQGKEQQIRFVCQLTRRPVVVTVRYTVPRGHVLRAADLTYVAVDDASGAVAKLEDVVGKEATRTLRKGEPIRSGDVRTIPLVRHNDIVTVYCRAPGIVVRRPFKARGEGALGEAIPLVSLDGREKIVATITGYHEAEIVPAGRAAVQRTAYEDATGAIRFQDGRPDGDRTGRPFEGAATSAARKRSPAGLTHSARRSVR